MHCSESHNKAQPPREGVGIHICQEKERQNNCGANKRVGPKLHMLDSANIERLLWASSSQSVVYHLGGCLRL